MTEENKTETTEVEKQVDTEESSSDSQDKTQEDGSDINNQPDYKAIAAQAQADKEKAENALANYRKGDKLYKEKKKIGEESKSGEDIDEEDKPMTRKDFREFQAQERQRSKNEIHAQQIHNIASSLAGSEDEKQAILAVHANRVFPDDMSIQEQLEEVKMIVNKDRIIGENSELRRALNSKANSTKEYASGQHDSVPSQAGEPKLSAQRKEILKDFTFNKETKQYEKKLSSGTLVHDPKTGQNKFVPNS